MHGRRRPFWSRLFAEPRRGTAKEKVLEYVVDRLDGGARLREVVADGYVRRRATPRDTGRVLADRRVVEAKMRRMRRGMRRGVAPDARRAIWAPEPPHERLDAWSKE